MTFCTWHKYLTPLSSGSNCIDSQLGTTQLAQSETDWNCNFYFYALNPAKYSQNMSCQVLEFGQTLEFFVNSLKSSHNFENRKMTDADDDDDDNPTVLPTDSR